MNWQEIKEKHPKALNLIYEWAIGDYDKAFISKIDFQYSNIRDLYDFFDEQDISIAVSISYFKEERWYEYEINTMWDKEYISSLDEPDYCEPYKTKTRTEAEEQAFLKAFEILENKLR